MKGVRLKVEEPSGGITYIDADEAQRDAEGVLLTTKTEEGKRKIWIPGRRVLSLSWIVK